MFKFDFAGAFSNNNVKNDVLSGITVALALVPEAVAFAFVAGVEPMVGLYAAFMMGLSGSTEAADALREELGLNMSAWDRYFNWTSGMLGGDFSISYTYRIPVFELVVDRMMVSVPLTIYALLLSTAIAIPVGVISASKRGTKIDTGLMGAAQFGVAIPNFWFAILLVLLFSTTLK